MRLPKEYSKINSSVWLYEGDCRQALPLLKDNSIDCILTDPPYEIAKLDQKWDRKQIKKSPTVGQTLNWKAPGCAFDKRQSQRLYDFMLPIAKESYRLLKPGGIFLCFSKDRLYHRMACAIEDAGFLIRSKLEWVKPNGAIGAQRLVRFIGFMDISEDEKKKLYDELKDRANIQPNSLTESIVLAQKPLDGTYVENWYKWGVGMMDVSQSAGHKPSTVLSYPSYLKRDDDGNIIHETMKPVGLIEELLSVYTKEGDVVLDMFLGSGTTAEASYLTGRKCIGIERDSYYCSYIRERIKGCKKKKVS